MSTNQKNIASIQNRSIKHNTIVQEYIDKSKNGSLSLKYPKFGNGLLLNEVKYNSIFVKQTSHYLHCICLFRYSQQIQFKGKKNEKQNRNYDSAKCRNLHFIIKQTCMSGPTSNMKYFNEYYFCFEMTSSGPSRRILILLSCNSHKIR